MFQDITNAGAGQFEERLWTPLALSCRSVWLVEIFESHPPFSIMNAPQIMLRMWTAAIEEIGHSLTANVPGGYKGSRKKKVRFTYNNTNMCNFIELAPHATLLSDSATNAPGSASAITSKVDSMLS